MFGRIEFLAAQLWVLGKVAVRTGKFVKVQVLEADVVVVLPNIWSTAEAAIFPISGFAENTQFLG
jgi:hypothetical protein